jgi:hypothetical protein
LEILLSRSLTPQHQPRVISHRHALDRVSFRGASLSQQSDFLLQEIEAANPFNNIVSSLQSFLNMAVNTRLVNAPIVLDNGSGTIRAGFAGEDLPKCYFPSFVGRPKHVRTMAGALEGDIFVGARAQGDTRGLLKINYPLEHGIVTDWDDMERIWQYVYAEGLKTLSEDVSHAQAISSERRH